MDIFDRIGAQVEQVFEGLTSEELNQQPGPYANTIGWLTWHLTRSHDRNLSELAGREQLWIKDKWYARFDRQPDLGETGAGHSPEEAAAFKAPDEETILEYHRAVVELAGDYINNRLSETDLDREAESPTFGNVATVERRLLGIISEGFQHAGQAAYVRGLIKGRGWR